MSAKEYWDDWDRDAGSTEVTASELVVTTHSSTDVAKYAPLSALLQRANRALAIEMVFVSETCGGEAVTRAGAEAAALHALHARSLLACMGPLRPAAFQVHTSPVITGDGHVHGTLCSRLPLRVAVDEQTAGALRGVAGLISNWFEAVAAEAG